MRVASTRRHFHRSGVFQKTPAGAVCALVAAAAMLPAGVSSFGAEEREEPATPMLRQWEPPSRPAFVQDRAGAVAPTRVHEIVSTEVTDLVLLPAGYRTGYRPGMVCRVIRGETEVAEIMLVEVRNEVSAAIIVDIFTDQIIEAGDIVRVKTLQHN